MNIKNWLKQNKINDPWFYANVHVYKDRALNDNLLYEFELNNQKTLQDYLDCLPKETLNKQIKYVEFDRGDSPDEVYIGICIGDK